MSDLVETIERAKRKVTDDKKVIRHTISVSEISRDELIRILKTEIPETATKVSAKFTF